MSDSQLLNTKWGRITSTEWLRRRYLEELEKWLPPEKLHLIFTRVPYYDENRQEIRDIQFECLVNDDPDQAWRQIKDEYKAFMVDLRVRRHYRQLEEAQASAAIRTYVSGKRKNQKKSNNKQPTLLD